MQGKARVNTGTEKHEWTQNGTRHGPQQTYRTTIRIILIREKSHEMRSGERQQKKYFPNFFLATSS